MRQWIFSILLAMLPISLHAKQLSDFTANFDIYMAGLPAGESVYSLQSNEDGTNTLKTISYATGLFKVFFSNEYVLSSTFEINADQVRPLSFSDEITGDEQSLLQRFDWDNATAYIEGDEKESELPLNPETQDVLSYHIKLASSLKQQLKQFSFPVLDNHKLRNYDISVLGNEVLKTELGEIDTIKITRKQSEKRTTYVWVAPALNYIPVQAEHVEGGITFLAKINELKRGDVTPPR